MAEWGREARRRQTGLLLTAHRAKGLEFDHVVVLGGDWLRSGANEDADATRRLYYVAMTRARKTLALARFARGQAWLDGLVGGMADSSFDSPAFLHRHATPLADAAARTGASPSATRLATDQTSTLPRAIPPATPFTGHWLHSP